jgi:hypothetical protein
VTLPPLHTDLRSNLFFSRRVQNRLGQAALDERVSATGLLYRITTAPKPDGWVGTFLDCPTLLQVCVASISSLYFPTVTSSQSFCSSSRSALHVSCQSFLVRVIKERTNPKQVMHKYGVTQCRIETGWYQDANNDSAFGVCYSWMRLGCSSMIARVSNSKRAQTHRRTAAFALIESRKAL